MTVLTEQLGDIRVFIGERVEKLISDIDEERMRKHGPDSRPRYLREAGEALAELEILYDAVEEMIRMEGE
jgi:hypothetical protein